MTPEQKQERDAVAAWLRQLTPEQLGWFYFGDLDDETLNGIADAIERGDHRESNG